MLRTDVISDDLWALIEPVMPSSRRPGRPWNDHRRTLEAIIWRFRTGSPWRDLPAELGNWHSTYTRFNRWCKRGRWLGIMSVLGADQDLEVLMIDSTVVRAHQHAAGAQKKRAIKPWDVPGVG